MSQEKDADLWLEAKLKKQRGMARAYDAATEEWKADTLEAVHQWCLTHETLFIDDFWSESGVPLGDHPKAVGPIFLEAVKRGWMEERICPTCRCSPSKRSVRSNQGRKAVWYSVIYKGSS